MTERVRELETAVAQLQATVDGLREELVDANERIRALERARDEPVTEPTETDSTTDETPFGLLDQEANEPADESDDDPTPVDDIIVA